MNLGTIIISHFSCRKFWVNCNKFFSFSICHLLRYSGNKRTQFPSIIWACDLTALSLSSMKCQGWTQWLLRSLIWCRGMWNMYTLSWFSFLSGEEILFIDAGLQIAFLLFTLKQDFQLKTALDKWEQLKNAIETVFLGLHINSHSILLKPKRLRRLVSLAFIKYRFSFLFKISCFFSWPDVPVKVLLFLISTAMAAPGFTSLQTVNFKG